MKTTSGTSRRGVTRRAPAQSTAGARIAIASIALMATVSGWAALSTAEPSPAEPVADAGPSESLLADLPPLPTLVPLDPLSEASASQPDAALPTTILAASSGSAPAADSAAGSRPSTAPPARLRSTSRTVRPLPAAVTRSSR